MLSDNSISKIIQDAEWNHMNIHSEHGLDGIVGERDRTMESSKVECLMHMTIFEKSRNLALRSVLGPI